MKIIAGSNSQRFAKDLSERLGIELLQYSTSKYSDGELKVKISGKFDETVIIVQSTSDPVNDSLMELLLLADALKKASVKNIIAVIPYFGYSRQDKSKGPGSPVGMSLVARLIESSGIMEVITFDLHNHNSKSNFNIPIKNILAEDAFISQISSDKNNVIISPDRGGIERSKKYADAIGVDLVIINKYRDGNDKCIMTELSGSVDGKNCIIIDDIVDSANTLCLAAALLKKQGAKKIEAIVTHGVLSGSAVDKIKQSNIDKIYISDSIECKFDIINSKFNIISVVSLLKNHIVI